MSGLCVCVRVCVRVSACARVWVGEWVYVREKCKAGGFPDAGSSLLRVIGMWRLRDDEILAFAVMC